MIRSERCWLKFSNSRHSILKPTWLCTQHTEVPDVWPTYITLPMDYILGDLMEMTHSTDDGQLTDDEFMAIMRTTNEVDTNTKSIREGKLDLLSLSGNKSNVIEGIVNLSSRHEINC
ncbi:unnamed protein product [Absidia cylindrospora]